MDRRTFCCGSCWSASKREHWGIREGEGGHTSTSGIARMGGLSAVFIPLLFINSGEVG